MEVSPMVNMGVEHRSSKKLKIDKQVPLPEGIILDILTRLPVKSLLRFKNVCKAWCDLISEPYFINLQLDQATQNPLFIVISYKVTNLTKKIHFYTYEEECHQSQPLMEWDVPDTSQLRLYPHTCDGLVLFHTEAHIHLCNPNIREFITLPQGSPNKPLTSISTQHVGFGFDTSARKYKVVRIFYKEINVNLGTYDMGCEIFDVGSHCWRAASVPPYPVSDMVPATVDGALYWVIHWCKRNESAHLLSFDLTTEQFAVIVVPPCSGSLWKNTIMPLSGLGDNLCLFVRGKDGGPDLDIWATKGNIGDEWVKLFHIYLKEWKSMVPCAFHKGKVLLISKKKRLYCYTKMEKRFRTVLTVRDKSDDDNPWNNAYMSFLNGTLRLRAGFYAESLVPIVADDIRRLR